MMNLTGLSTRLTGMNKAVLILFLLIFCGTARAEIDKLTVTKAWKRIVKADGFQNTPIYFEKDLEPNAWVKFEDENKYTVHVTKGLMKILANEDEIAGVLGHELGHIRLGHYSGMVLTDTARTVMGINSEIAYDISAAVGKTEMELHESSFSRKQETEADDYGTALLRKARYKPRGLYDAIIKLETNGYGTGKNGFSSHPSTNERLINLAEKAGITPGINDGTVIGMEDIANILLGRK